MRGGGAFPSRFFRDNGLARVVQRCHRPRGDKGASDCLRAIGAGEPRPVVRRVDGRGDAGVGAGVDAVPAVHGGEAGGRVRDVSGVPEDAEADSPRRAFRVSGGEVGQGEVAGERRVRPGVAGDVASLALRGHGGLAGVDGRGRECAGVDIHGGERQYLAEAEPEVVRVGVQGDDYLAAGEDESGMRQQIAEDIGGAVSQHGVPAGGGASGGDAQDNPVARAAGERATLVARGHRG